MKSNLKNENELKAYYFGLMWNEITGKKAESSLDEAIKAKWDQEYNLLLGKAFRQSPGFSEQGNSIERKAELFDLFFKEIKENFRLQNEFFYVDTIFKDVETFLFTAPHDISKTKDLGEIAFRNPSSTSEHLLSMLLQYRFNELLK